MKKFNLKKILAVTLITFFPNLINSAEQIDPIKVNWSFKGLAGKFDREVMMEYLQMDRQELIELLMNCNYSEYFIKKASDLQVIEAILDCYENYKALKKGKINRNKIPVND